ncbi:DUF58 domain-containing protein [Arcanobacterium wilhelmae]|uniref:DUF58 domain-containing protein n=1 Tax=Arcanobacterium wilhelmae TaxID=1803177 RepID=UPI0024151DCB|nr:DUF58 domain-containing protein [Arcanobacterium wilhelmae]WFN90191.1 DUF58 domain-containing protein [Arcanobacterium wilhelmae]
MRRLTPLGWGVALASVFGWVAGWALGWVELIGMGVFTLVLLVLAWVASLGRSSLAAEIELATVRVVAGASGVGELKVRNTGSRKSRAVWLELPVGQGSSMFAIPRLAPGESHDAVFTIPTTRRGMVQIGPVSSVRSDPIGLVYTREPLSGSEEFFVHPKRAAVALRALGFLKDVEGRASRELSSSDVSFRALRGYVPGDPRRAIHWKTSARKGTLMVREFDDTRRSHMLVVLDSAPQNWASDDEFELGVSLAASIAATEINEERIAQVAFAGELLADPTPMRLMDSFTMVERTPATTFVAGVSDAVTHVPGASVIVLVTGQNTAREEVRAALATVPAGARAVVVRAGAHTELSDLVGVPVLGIENLQIAPLAAAKAVR